MLELFMCLMLELLELFKKIYSLGVNLFSFEICDLKILGLFLVFYIFH